MRVLNVNTHLNPVTGGGTAERTFQMSRYLVKSGHECAILTTDCGMTDQRRMDLSGIELIDMRCVIKRIFLPMIQMRRIRNIIKWADVIHLMGNWSIVNVIAYIYARIMGKPYVVCSAGTFIIFGRSSFMKRVFNAVIGKRIIRNADGHIAISKDEIEHFAAFGIERGDVTVIPNGISVDDCIDNAAEGFRAQFGIGSDPYILYVGRLNYYKGPDLLLQAYHRVMHKMPNYKLVFAGPDEDMLEWMKKYVADNCLRENVYFVGHISGALKTQAYNGCELVVIPSRRDAMSIVVLEAGAAAKPIIITRDCGFNEIRDIEGGIVVEASVESIADGLTKYVNNKSEFRNIGNNLYEMVTAQYSWDHIIDSIISLYSGILRRVGR